MQVIQRQRWLERLLERSPDYVSFGLVIVCGVLLARLTWTLFPATPQSAQLEMPATANGQAAVAQDLGSQIAAQHLFGAYAPAKPPAGSQAVPASQLALKLWGVYALQGNKGMAIIGEKSGKQQVVSVGQAIGKLAGQPADKSDAVLEQVFADHVLLRRNGQLEKLLLPKLGEGGAGNASAGSGDSGANAADAPPPSQMEDSTPPPAVQPLDLPSAPPAGVGDAPPLSNAIPPQGAANGFANPAPAESSLSGLRQAAAQNPMRLMEAVSPSPYSANGKFIGYRLEPGSNQALFNQSGLHPGDIATAINGTALDSPSTAAQALQSAASGSSVSLQITRSGQQLSLSIPF